MPEIIAEFCQNHNGKMEILARMIEAAAKAGATHGKMQSISADTVTYRPQFEEGLTVDGKVKSIKRPYLPEFNRLRGLEISESDTSRFIRICQDNGLVPMTTCFARSHVRALADAGFRSIKVASYDCASFPMLKELRANFPEVIVSTGATYDDEIIHAAELLDNANYAFLHCVTLYPTPLNSMHLARMDWLRTLAPRVGFSDHSLLKRDNLIASKAALAMGAEIIERHFTILDPSETRDGPVSVNPAALADLVAFTKLTIEERKAELDKHHPNWTETIGQSKRSLSDEELLNRDYYRGRFASPRPESVNGMRMIFNWEETPI